MYKLVSIYVFVSVCWYFYCIHSNNALLMDHIDWSTFYELVRKQSLQSLPSFKSVYSRDLCICFEVITTKDKVKITDLRDIIKHMTFRIKSAVQTTTPKHSALFSLLQFKSFLKSYFIINQKCRTDFDKFCLFFFLAKPFPWQ